MKYLNTIPPEHQPTPEDLPGDLSLIASEIERHRPGQGVDIAVILAQTFRGQQLYICNIDPLFRKVRDEAIRNEYDQGMVTMRQLASKWKLSHRRIKEILAQPGKKRAR